MNANTRLRNTPYLADSPTPKYVQAIRAARSPGQLQAAILPYRDLAEDAYEQAQGVRWNAWLWAKRNAKKEEQAVKVTAIAGHILCPSVMMHLELMVFEYKVPWGCVLHRAMDLGLLKIERGVFKLTVTVRRAQKESQ